MQHAYPKEPQGSRGIQATPEKTAGIHSHFLSFVSEDGFALLCTFVARVSISGLAQLNAVGCGGKDVADSQDFGRSICRTYSKASTVVLLESHVD